MYSRFGTDGVKDDSNGQLFAEKDSLALFEVMKPERRALSSTCLHIPVKVKNVRLRSRSGGGVLDAMVEDDDGLSCWYGMNVEIVSCR